MEQLSKKCVNCGKVFFGDYAHGKDVWRKRRYCSTECKAESERGEHRAPALTKTCQHCGKKFFNRRASGRAIEPGRWKMAKFCSPKCRWASQEGKAWGRGISTEDVSNRFMRHVEKLKDGTGCWRWTAKTSETGYGSFAVDGATRLAHRAAYELFVGRIPKGKGFHGTCVCHKCDHPWCVNPKHLFLGTIQRDIKDKSKKGRQARGARHGRAKLTEVKVQMIRSLDATGLYTKEAIADQFRITRETVWSICAGETWSYLA
jgi:hypothetical protein